MQNAGRWFSSKASLVALAAILILGTFLRLHDLGGSSLWIDEIQFVTGFGFHPTSVIDIWKQTYREYFWNHQLPLPATIDFVFVRALRLLDLPVNEASYRFPMAIAGIVGLAFMYLLARRLFSERMGVIAAFLLSISFFHVFYSREAYNYIFFLLSALLSSYFLVEVLMQLWRGEHPTKKVLTMYAVCTALTLQMHMAAIFFVFAQFLFIMASAWIGPLRQMSNPRKSRCLAAVVVAHLAAWIPIAPFLWIVLFGYRSIDVTGQQEVGIGTLFQMIGEMGWGSHAGPLILFVGLFLYGCWVSLRKFESRWLAILCLMLGGVSALGVGVSTRWARFETRYFIASLPTLLLFVAAAWDHLIELAAAKLPRIPYVVTELLFCAVLLLWHIPMYHQLFLLKGKLVCGRELADWINQNTPPGTSYILDNAHVRREVPVFYPTPGRSGSGTPEYGSVEEFHKKDVPAFLREVFQRFPECYYIDTQHIQWEGSPISKDEWLQKTFRRHAQIENPALIALIDMGIFPSGVFWSKHKEIVTTDIYYNTKADLLAMRRAAGESWLVLFGPEWVHCEVPRPTSGLDHWKGLHSKGSVVIYGLKPEPFPVQIRMLGGGFRKDQSIFVHTQGKEIEYHLSGDRPQWVNLGEIIVQPGPNQITIRKAVRQDRNETANLLVHEIVVRPIAAR